MTEILPIPKGQERRGDSALSARSAPAGTGRLARALAALGGVRPGARPVRVKVRRVLRRPDPLMSVAAARYRTSAIPFCEVPPLVVSLRV